MQSFVWHNEFPGKHRSCADDNLAAVGGTYEFTRFAAANLRERDDSLNTAIGGFLAGSVLGLRCKLSLTHNFTVFGLKLLVSWLNTSRSRIRCSHSYRTWSVRLYRRGFDRTKEQQRDGRIRAETGITKESPPTN